MAIKIGIDCGHGLRTSGKQTPDGIKEWTLNDKVADKVAVLLKDYDCEILRLDNDEGYTDETLANRLNRYVQAGVAAMVSIHHNAYMGKWNNVTGVEVYTDRNPTTYDTQLANAIYSRLVKYTGLKGRGVKAEAWYVINQNRIPAVLTEGGFMDSNIDYKVITSDAGQTAYAKAVAEGLIEFLKLKKKTTTTAPTTTAKSSDFKPYKVKVICSALNIRKTPQWSDNDIVGVIKDKGTYTIVGEKMLDGTKFGKLKSGAGWISLGSSYVKKV